MKCRIVRPLPSRNGCAQLMRAIASAVFCHQSDAFTVFFSRSSASATRRHASSHGNQFSNTSDDANSTPSFATT